jgi:hypothetical protein
MFSLLNPSRTKKFAKLSQRLFKITCCFVRAYQLQVQDKKILKLSNVLAGTVPQLIQQIPQPGHSSSAITAPQTETQGESNSAVNRAQKLRRRFTAQAARVQSQS